MESWPGPSRVKLQPRVSGILGVAECLTLINLLGWEPSEKTQTVQGVCAELPEAPVGVLGVESAKKPLWGIIFKHTSVPLR